MAEPNAPPAPAPEPQVDVLDKVGRRGTIPASQLEAAKAQGYVEASSLPPEDKGVYERAREMGVGPVGAAGFAISSPFVTTSTGGLTGATAGAGTGLSKAIASKLGSLTSGIMTGKERTPEEVAKEFDYIYGGGAHPFLQAGGEMVGMVAGMKAAPGLVAEGGLARIAGKGLGAIESAGNVASSAARNLTGGLGKLGALGRAAQSGIELGARGAAEMGAYEGIKELSEEAFGDPKLSAEKILAAAAHGAEGGALFGAGLGAGGSLVKSGARGLAGLAQGVASRNADAFQKAANEHRWRATGARQQFTKEAERRFPGGVQGIGETLREYGIGGGTAREAAGGAGEIGSVLEQLDDALDRVGAKLGDDMAASTATVNAGKLSDAINEIIAPVRGKAGQEAISASLDTYRRSLFEKLVGKDRALEIFQLGPEAGEEALRKLEFPLQDVLFQRKALDDLVYKEAKSLDPIQRVEYMRDIRGRIEDTLMSSFDDAARMAGDDLARARVEKLKRDYQALSLSKKAAETANAASMSNRSFGLTDYITGGIVSGIGTTVGGAIGGDYGAGVGGALGGMAGARVNKLMRSRGNAIMANALERLAAFGGKPRLVAEMADGASVASALEREVAAAEGRASKIAEETAGHKRSLEEPVAEATGAAAPKVEEAILEVAPNPAAAPEPPKPPAGGFQRQFDKTLVEQMGATTTTPAELEQAGASIFGRKVPDAERWKNTWKVPEGYELKFDSVDAYGSPDDGWQMFMNATIHDASGKHVGDMTRAFERDANGNLIVHHEYLSLDKDVQGNGIGSALSKSALEAYHDLGINRIEIHAALTAGPYVWARQGYRWNEGEMERMRQEAADWGMNRALDFEELEGLQKAVEQGPRAVTENPMGKQFLLETGGWRGHLPVEEAYADMLQKAADFERAQAAIKAVDVQVDKAVKGVVGDLTSESMAAGTPYRDKTPTREAKVRSVESAKSEPLHERYEKAKKDVENLQSNLDAAVRRASIPVESMPQTSQALGVAAMRAGAIAMNSQPRAINTPTLGRPLPSRPSVADMNAFVQRADVYRTHGMAAIRAFQRGQVTVNQARALGQIAPNLMADLQQKALREVQERQAMGKPIDFHARQRLSILLGIQTDPCQNPRMMANLQANFEPEPPPSPAAPPPQQQPMPGPPPPSPATLASPSDRLEQRQP